MTRSLPHEAPLSTVVIAMSIPESVLAQLRATFPEIRFVIPEEDGDGVRDATLLEELPTDALRVADAIIGWHVPAEVVAAAPRLRWIHSGGAGVNRFDLAAIAQRGIVLTNASGVSAPNMAEHVLGMMIALARRIPQLVQAQRRREWRDQATHQEVTELQGQTVLVVGMGEIGREVATRTAAFGMRVHGLRRKTGEPPPSPFEAVFGPEELPSAVAGADHVVLALPDTPQTRGLFDEVAFAAMKRGAKVYNVGRGPVIDTQALIDALQTGRLGGAGLDVTDPEPLPADSPLWEMENVLITAHTSGATPRYWERQGALIAENIGRFQRGEPLRNVVDLGAGY